MSPRGWLLGALASGLLASGCLGGQSGTETDDPNTCGGTRTVQSDEVTKNGTIEALAADVEEAVSVPMRIIVDESEGSTVDTTLTLVASVARFWDMFIERPSGSRASGGACETLLTAPAVLHFDAADGSFMDVFTGTLERSAERTAFSATLPLEQHQGTLDLTALAAKNYENPVLHVMTTLGPMPSGQLFLEGDSRDKNPNVVATSASIAGWPP